MLAKLTPLLGAKPRIFEPTAGRGALVKLLRKAFPLSYIVANEIDRERYETLRDAGADCTTHLDLFDDVRIRRERDFDLAFTNPPFFVAQQVAEKLITMADHVVLLQRCNWLASLDRLEFWQRNAADLWLLPKRPSFAASLKCGREEKRGGCGWKRTQYLDDARPTRCPGEWQGAPCQARVDVSTTDSIEYAWFHFHAGSLRQYGHLARLEPARQQSLLEGGA
jgi:hypothetical protein